MVNPRIYFSLNNNEIKNYKPMKLLGINLESRLNWESHAPIMKEIGMSSLFTEVQG